MDIPPHAEAMQAMLGEWHDGTRREISECTYSEFLDQRKEQKHAANKYYEQEHAVTHHTLTIVAKMDRDILPLLILKEQGSQILQVKVSDFVDETEAANLLRELADEHKQGGITKERLKDMRNEKPEMAGKLCKRKP